jgi:hypothetical protein
MAVDVTGTPVSAGGSDVAITGALPHPLDRNKINQVKAIPFFTEIISARINDH